MEVVRKQYGGEDCIACCPVRIECDCDLIECVHLFGVYAINRNREQYTGHLSQEVIKANHALMGLVVFGTIERPIIDGEIKVDFGRTLIKSYIDSWGWDEGDSRTYLQEIYRILHEYWECFKTDCGCAEGNENRVDCQALDCIMTSIQEFIQIGLTGRPPYTLKEWAEGGICGVCYQDCEGEPYVFDKTAAAPAN